MSREQFNRTSSGNRTRLNNLVQEELLMGIAFATATSLVTVVAICKGSDFISRG